MWTMRRHVEVGVSWSAPRNGSQWPAGRTRRSPMSTATATHNGPAGDLAGARRMRAQRGRVEHFTPAERAARGKAARAEVPRSSHAGWEPASGRGDPVDVLEEQAQTRVPELVPIRYGRMLVSPFTFYRGAAGLMASDLADAPRTGL